MSRYRWLDTARHHMLIGDDLPFRVSIEDSALRLVSNCCFRKLAVVMVLDSSWREWLCSVCKVLVFEAMPARTADFFVREHVNQANVETWLFSIFDDAGLSPLACSISANEIAELIVAKDSEISGYLYPYKPHRRDRLV